MPSDRIGLHKRRPRTSALPHAGAWQAAVQRRLGDPPMPAALEQPAASAARAGRIGHQFGRMPIFADVSPSQMSGAAAPARGDRSNASLAQMGQSAAPSGAHLGSGQGTVAVQRFVWPFDVWLYQSGMLQTDKWSKREFPVAAWTDLVALLGRLPPDRVQKVVEIKEKHERTKATTEEEEKARRSEIAHLVHSSDNLILTCKTFYSRYMTASAARYAKGQRIQVDLPFFAESIADITNQAPEKKNIQRYLDQIAAIATWDSDQLYAQLGAKLTSDDVFWEVREQKEAKGPRQIRVAVVGAGPAGLAAAIEARLMGARVTLYEWRERYERDNAITLRDQAIDKLRYFGVYDQLVKGPGAKGLTDIGGQPALSIRYLEEALLERALQLNVDFERGASIASITPHGAKRIEVRSPERGDPQGALNVDDEAEETFDYDILVAADAKNSALRGVSPELARSSIHGGHAIVYAAAQFAAGNAEVNRATGAETVEGVGTFQVPAPNVYYVLMEVPASVLEQAVARAKRVIAAENKARRALHIEELTLEDVKSTMDANFEEELERLGRIVAKKSGRMGRQGLKGAKPQKIAPFDVELTQARSFADLHTGVVLVGDAAATTNPFEGQGASTALYESGLVSELVERFSQENGDRVAALKAYDAQMRMITTRFMIEKPLQQTSPDYYAKAGLVWRDGQGNYFVSLGGKNAYNQPTLKRVPTPGRP